MTWHQSIRRRGKTPGFCPSEGFVNSAKIILVHTNNNCSIITRLKSMIYIIAFKYFKLDSYDSSPVIICRSSSTPFSRIPQFTLQYECVLQGKPCKSISFTILQIFIMPSYWIPNLLPTEYSKYLV